MKSIVKSKNRLSALAMIIALLVVMTINMEDALWKKDNRVLRSDVNQYYAYLPAIFVHHDITLQFFHQDWTSLGANFYPKRSPTWELVILYTCGVSVLYFPFFIVAHALAPLLGYPASGFSLPYQFAIQMSSWFYLFLGLLFLRKLLLKYFEDQIVAIVLVATVIGTNMLWYVTGEAAMSHVYSFFLITTFLYLLDVWLEKGGVLLTIFLGLFAGLISLVRPTNALVGIFIILWRVSSWHDLKNRFTLLLDKWYILVLMVCMALVAWLPQLLYWKMVTGTYFYYSYPDDQGFFFNNPQLFNNLLSWRKGWLIYVPVMVFSLLGIALSYKVKKPFFWALTIYFLLAWYVVSSWWSWGYGGGLSIRPYIDSYGIFAFGMAAFLTWVFRQRIWLRIPVFILFVFTLWNGAHNVARFAHGSLHFDGNTKATQHKSNLFGGLF